MLKIKNRSISIGYTPIFQNLQNNSYLHNQLGLEYIFKL